jgi:hypothetical protein
MAAERIRDDYEKRLGELQTLIDLTDFDNAVDLNQMAFRAEGLAQLEAAERKVTAAEAADPEGGARSLGAAPAAAALPPAPGAAASPEDRWRSRVRPPRG